MQKQFRWLLCAVFLLLAAAPASADSILLGTSGSSNGSGLLVDAGHFGAQAFTLTSTVQVTGLNLFLARGQGQSLLIQLTNAIGPSATSANVLAQTTIAFPSALNGTWISAPLTNLVLPVGTYHIVLSLSSGDGEWRFLPTILPSSVGTVGAVRITSPSGVNLTLPPASSFFGIGAGPFGFQIVGNTHVPEPGTLLLVAMGLGAFIRRSRTTR